MVCVSVCLCARVRDYVSACAPVLRFFSPGRRLTSGMKLNTVGWPIQTLWGVEGILHSSRQVSGKFLELSNCPGLAAHGLPPFRSSPAMKAYLQGS